METCPLETWLTERGKTLSEVARSIGAPKSAISSYISGKRGLRLARYYELAKLTGIEAHTLIEWSAKHEGADVDGARRATRRKPARRRAS